ncbi:MAG: DUF6624 domain-containing protein [Verrucomicrobiota bacterium]
MKSIIFFLCSSVSLFAQSEPKVRFDAALRTELSAMADADQRFRQTPTFSKEEWANVDGRHLKRMKEIIEKYGWPGRSLVGESGAANAWLLIQHCDSDPQFQELCVALLEKAVAAGEAKAVHHAYLLDRVRMHQRKPQVYGTQFEDDAPYPIEDIEHVDERRRAVGLGPLQEYIDHMRALIEKHQELESKKPNKAPEPTPTAVTSPAAQEPRQP